MLNTGYIALSRQTALMRQMDVVSNNIANANTAGFKGEHVLFAEHLVRGQAEFPMSYVQDLAVARDTRQGSLTITGAELDLALQGNGYLALETPAGVRYSRGGSFQLDAERRIVSTQGYTLLDENDRPITVPQGSGKIAVNRDGAVTSEGVQVGRIRLVSFENEQQLRKTAGGLYTTDAQPRPAQGVQVLQGMVEQANVQPVVEMTRMMGILREFQANQKMVESEHERQMRAIRELPNLQNA